MSLLILGGDCGSITMTDLTPDQSGICDYCGNYTKNLYLSVTYDNGDIKLFCLACGRRIKNNICDMDEGFIEEDNLWRSCHRKNLVVLLVLLLLK